jgi:hypothetical protein
MSCIDRLEKHFGNLITMQPQQGQGMSNLIHSSTISTPESIGAATRIKADMLSATVEDLINVAHICDESQILRKQVVVCVMCNYPFHLSSLIVEMKD